MKNHADFRPKDKSGLRRNQMVEKWSSLAPTRGENVRRNVIVIIVVNKQKIDVFIIFIIWRKIIYSWDKI